MTGDEPRDLVGYGPDPPFADWPGGSRVALNFVINFEEGSELSIPDGDGISESGLTDGPNTPFGPGKRDLAAESMFEYGSRAGFWRLMRLFDERSLPTTIFACARALERNPLAAKAIVVAGHDICCHGWRWVMHSDLNESEERDHIRRAVESLERTVGGPPLGWYCRYTRSINTRRLLVEHGGFLYDSDSYNDDLPYWTNEYGRPHLVIPYTMVNNDANFLRGNLSDGEDFYRFARGGIEQLRSEGGTAPKMMSIGLHMRIAGHPGRAHGLARLLDHVRSLDDVWVCRRIDIAHHWIARHPFEAGDKPSSKRGSR